MQNEKLASTFMEKLFLKRIGQNIRKWRILRGVKLEQLAHNSGITKGALSLIENGKTNTSLLRIHNIAIALKIAEDILMFKDPLYRLEESKLFNY